MGIPTIRRDKVDYLTDTVKSLIEGMTPEEQAMCLIIVFVAEVSFVSFFLMHGLAPFSIAQMVFEAFFCQIYFRIW